MDVVVADTAADAPGGTAPSVVLAQAPARLSVPAFDPRVHNPTGWQRRGFHGVAALGPLEHLPPDSPADRVVPSEESRGIRWIPPTKQVLLRGIHHLEDVQAFHRDAAARAAEIARLAATGVVVHLADGGPGLEPWLGAELFGLMTAGVRDLDAAGREALSVRMRRAALRGHSLESRVAAGRGAGATGPPAAAAGIDRCGDGASRAAGLGARGGAAAGAIHGWSWFSPCRERVSGTSDPARPGRLYR